MSVDEMSNMLEGLTIEHHHRVLKHQNSECLDSAGHQEKGRLTRKSSTSSTGSTSLEKRKMFQRKDSEVKIEAIFKELFSPDARIIDHYEGDVVIPGLQFEENDEEEVLPNHERFKLRRQTSLVRKPKEELPRKTSTYTRTRTIARKSPAPVRKTSTPTQRKRSTSSKAPLPKMSAPPSLKPNFVTVADDSSSPLVRKNPIPLRRGLSVAHK